MKTLRKNWKLSVVTCALVVFAGAWWWMGSTATAQGVEEPHYADVTETQRQQLFDVLAQIDLDLSAMAALNLTEQQAEDVLAAARNWWEQNEDDLGALANTVGVKRAALDDLQKSRRMGGQEAASPEDVNTARGELATACAAYDAGFRSLETALNAELSDTQESTWRVIQHGWGRQLPMRMLDLTSDQRHDYARAMRIYRLQMAAASNASERNAAQSAFDASVAEILTQDNQTLITTYESYIAESSQAVQSAIQTVLPLAGQA